MFGYGYFLKYFSCRSVFKQYLFYFLNFFLRLAHQDDLKYIYKKFNLFKIQAQLRFNLEPSIIYM